MIIVEPSPEVVDFLQHFDFSIKLDQSDILHFGRKGMKWGQRQARSTDDSDSGSEPRQGMSAAKKVAIGGAVLGAAVVGVLIARNRGSITKSISSARKSASTAIGEKVTMALFKKTGIGQNGASSFPRLPRKKREQEEKSTSPQGFLIKQLKGRLG